MTPFLQNAGWALIHFVWQGAAIVLVAALALRLTERRSANIRYVIGCLALAAMLAAPVMTARLVWTATPQTPRGARGSGVSDHDSLSPDVAPAPPRVGKSAERQRLGDDRDSSPALSSAPGQPTTFRLQQLARFVPAITIAWLVGVALLLGRMAGGWWHVRRLHRVALATPSSRWQTRLPPPRVSARAARRRPRGGVGARRSADGRRLAAPGDSAAGGGDRLAVAGAGRSDPRARARAHPPPRLRGEPAADDRRDAAVLSPGRLVGVERASAPSASTAATRWRCAFAAMRSAMRGRSPSSRPGARCRRAMALAATGGSLLDRVRRILRVPMTDEPRSPSWAVTLALTMIFAAGAGSVQHCRG